MTIPADAATRPPPGARRSPAARVAAVAAIGVVLAAGVAWSQRDRLSRHPAPSGAPSAATASPSGSARAPAPPLVVDGHRVRPERVAATVTATGTLLAREQVDLVAEVSRRVVKVNAADGALVKKGDVLFVLDAADLAAQARTLEVRKKLALENEKRARQLASEGLASAQELERLVAERSLAEAQLAELGVALSRTTIRAPFAGRLGLVQVSQGAWVSPSTRLATLQDLTQVRVDFTLPERHAPSLRTGTRVRFRVPGRDGHHEGTIVAVEPRIDAATRSVQARALADNPEGQLLPGGFVTVELELGADQAGIVVPSMAVIPTGGGHAVFVARDGKAAEVAVEVGVRTETTVQILKGLAPGDVVLTTNLLRVRPGAPVTLRTVEEAAVAPPPSAAAPPPSATAPPPSPAPPGERAP